MDVVALLQSRIYPRGLPSILIIIHRVNTATMSLQSIFRTLKNYNHGHRSPHEANNEKLLSRFLDVFSRTWDLGFTAFGGPPVHFRILYQRFVDGEGKTPWIDEQTVRLIYIYICLSDTSLVLYFYFAILLSTFSLRVKEENWINILIVLRPPAVVPRTFRDMSSPTGSRQHQDAILHYPDPRWIRTCPAGFLFVEVGVE